MTEFPQPQKQLRRTLITQRRQMPDEIWLQKSQILCDRPISEIANLYHHFQIDISHSDRQSLVQINEFNLDLPS